MGFQFNKKYLAMILPLLAVLTFSMLSAHVYCGQSSINMTNLQPGTITCRNAGNLTVNLSPGGYFTLSKNSLPANMSSSTPITITPLSGLSSGIYLGKVYFSDGTNPINVSIVYASQQNKSSSGTCNLVTLNNIGNIGTLTGGTNGTVGPITIYSPDCTGLKFTPSTIQGTSYFKVGSSTTNQQGNQYSFYLNYNVPNIQNANSQHSIEISALNSNGQYATTNIYFDYGVSIGGSQEANLTSLPTCSLNTNTFSLNESYNFKCTNLNSNIIITPLIDSNYLVGTNLQLSSSTYDYTFKPVQIGSTTFSAQFMYNGVPIGKPFSQLVAITPSGINSTQINATFNPSLNSLQGSNGPWNVTLQATDSITNTLITNAQFYINGKLVNSTFLIHPDATYALRIHAPGYRDYTKTLDIKPNKLSVSINPENPTAEIPFNISLSPKNSTLFINGIMKNVTNGTIKLTLNQGNYNITVNNTGYVLYNDNLTIAPPVSANLTTKWGQNQQQVFILSKSVNWTVRYSKDASSQTNQIASGVGTKVIFTPQNAGLYQIFTGNAFIAQDQIKQSAFVEFLQNYWWAIIVGVVIILAIIVLIIRIRSGSSNSWIPSNVGQGSFVSA